MEKQITKKLSDQYGGGIIYSDTNILDKSTDIFNFTRAEKIKLAHLSTGCTECSGGTTNLYTNLTPTPSTIGGISSGSIFSGLTVSQMFDELLYPELFPALANPSATFTSLTNAYYEVGSLISSITFNSIFSRGSINPAYSTSGYRSGLPTQYNYIGYGLTNVITASTSNINIINNYIVSGGTQSWSGNVTYSGGEQPKSSKGNNYSTPLSSGTTTLITKSFNGIYPFLYGMSSTELNGSTLYPEFSLNKILEVQGNKILILDGSLKYIYFAYPSAYSDLTSILDQNGFNVTNSFTKTLVSVVSDGLASNFTATYKVYRTNDITSVTNGAYQFKFS